MFFPAIEAIDIVAAGVSIHGTGFDREALVPSILVIGFFIWAMKGAPVHEKAQGGFTLGWVLLLAFLIFGLLIPPESFGAAATGWPSYAPEGGEVTAFLDRPAPAPWSGIPVTPVIVLLALWVLVPSDSGKAKAKPKAKPEPKADPIAQIVMDSLRNGKKVLIPAVPLLAFPALANAATGPASGGIGVSVGFALLACMVGYVGISAQNSGRTGISLFLLIPAYTLLFMAFAALANAAPAPPVLGSGPGGLYLAPFLATCALMFVGCFFQGRRNHLTAQIFFILAGIAGLLAVPFEALGATTGPFDMTAESASWWVVPVYLLVAICAALTVPVAIRRGRIFVAVGLALICVHSGLTAYRLSVPEAAAGMVGNLFESDGEKAVKEAEAERVRLEAEARYRREIALLQSKGYATAPAEKESPVVLWAFFGVAVVCLVWAFLENRWREAREDELRRLQIRLAVAESQREEPFFGQARRQIAYMGDRHGR